MRVIRLTWPLAGESPETTDEKFLLAPDQACHEENLLAPGQTRHGEILLAPDQARHGEVLLAPDQARHGVTVLRLSPGDRVEMVGPRGLAPALVTTADTGRGRRRPVRLGVRLIGPWSRPELPPGPRLAVGLIQLQRFDWVVEKAVELGAGVLLPWHTARVKPGLAEGGARREDRWRRLAEEARKQCGRTRPLEIGPPATFPQLLTLPGPKFYLTPHSHSGAPAAKSSPLVAVGPEGGFSPEEEAELAAAGFQAWRLGAAVLRTETAALTALAVLMNGDHS